MANIKSQIKRNKQNEKRHERNKAVKSELKTAVRKFREAVEAGDKDKAVELGRDAATQARQGRLQGRHPQEPGRQPQVLDRRSAPPLSDPPSSCPPTRPGSSGGSSAFPSRGGRVGAGPWT